ncbi:hypothetical protein DFJ73DRAFT_947752 [Zopfochytrium polystomum]|nr:hypothetical protein DFJ73DRAFT_947752 [Zopfochytrium polystomum]
MAFAVATAMGPSPPLLLLLLLLLLLPSPPPQDAATTVSTNTTLAIGTFCTPDGALFCLRAERNLSTPDVTFTITTASASGGVGWVSLGVGGATMNTATLYLAYADGRGGATLSQRETWGHVVPEADGVPQDFVLVAGRSDAQRLSATFRRAAAAAASRGLADAGPTTFIYAVGDAAAGPTFAGCADPRRADCAVGEHLADGFGSFRLDLTTPGVHAGIPPSIEPGTLRELHGFLMFLAWGVLPVLGVFSARHLKDALGHGWYRLHVFCMIAGPLLLSLLALLVIESELPPGQPRFVSSPGLPHRVLGAALVLVAAPAQAWLGWAANAAWRADRAAVPWWPDKVHWWVGRGALAAATLATVSGMLVFGAAPVMFVAYAGWLGAVGVAFVVGQVRFGVVHHVARGGSHVDVDGEPVAAAAAAAAATERTRLLQPDGGAARA